MTAPTTTPPTLPRQTEGLFAELQALPATDRGRKHALTAVCSPKVIELASRFIDESGIEAQIDEWLRLDHPNRERRIGRPESVPIRAVLVAELALAMSRLPVSVMLLHHVITSPLDAKSRRHLGFTVDKAVAADTVNDMKRRAISYPSVARMHDKITDTYDPQPFPTHRALTPTEVAKIQAGRDMTVVVEKQQRADRLQAIYLLACYRMLPKHLRRRYRGDVTLDATADPIHGKHGHNTKTRVAGRNTRSPEANAGWHANHQDKRDAANRPGNAAAGEEFTFAYDAHLALMTYPETYGTAEKLPALVLGLSLDRASVAPGLNAVHALAGLKAAGLPTKTLTVDLGYSQLKPENYALPVKALGYDLMHMFKHEELGKIQANYGGLIVVEGTVYGPCLPAILRTAVKDHAEGKIDDATLEARLEQRRAFQARAKRTKTGEHAYVYRCPGCGEGRTVRCDWKEISDAQEAREAKGRKTLPLVIERPARQDEALCCANKQSVSVPYEVFARYVTAHPYMTPEWRLRYRTARQEMEGKNSFLKNPLGVDLATPGERRFRGWAKQFLAILVKLVAANVQTMIAWIDKDSTTPAPMPRKRTGRPRKPTLLDHTIDATGPPLRIVGHPLPEPLRKNGEAA